MATTVTPGGTAGGEAATGLRPSYERLIEQERTRRVRSAITGLLLLSVVAACAWLSGLLDARRLSQGIPDVLDIVGEMLPPDFTHARDWARPLLDTLAMSVAGTALALALSLPLALLAATTTSPHRSVYHLARAVLNALRSVPELIMGIVFVAAVGFGALPGVLALGLHSVGMVGKFFAETIEHADRAPVEAIRATGASPMQIRVHGVLAQVLPQFADVALYRWEYNFRASTTLGLVGAGGIGFELMASLRTLNYREAAALMLVIFATVTAIDALSAKLRRRLR
jgi:phosphonate transport system permease protein